MNKDRRQADKNRLRLVERYENDDYSNFAGPDFEEEPFELGENDFEQSSHTDKRNINLRSEGSWTNPGVSGKSDDGESWVNNKEYQKQTSFVGYGPRGYKRSDDRIYEEVCDTLMRSADVDATNIGVKVESGIVTLSGKVSSRNMKKIAERIIDDLPGVQDVRNELNVMRKEEVTKGPDKVHRNDLGIN